MSFSSKGEKKSNKLIGAIWYLISSLFPALSSFIIFSIATRQILPSQLGSISLALTITMFLISICCSGFGDALIQRKNIDKKHISTVFVLLLLTSIAAYSVSLLFVLSINFRSFDPLFKTAYIIFGIKLILDTCAVLPLSLLTREMEFKKIGIRTIVCSTGATIVCIPILFLGGGVWAIILSQITSSIISFSILWTSSKQKPELHFCTEAFKDLRGFGFKTTMAKIVSSINVDNLVLGAVGTLHALGVYTFSRRVFSVINDVLTGAMSNVSYPLYASLQNEQEKLKNIFLKTTFISTLISFPAFIGLFLISEYIVPLIFGSQWEVAVFGVRCCCFIGFISCIGTLQLSLIKGLGRTTWILKYQLFQQSTTAILALIFAKKGADAVMLAITIKTYLVWPYTIYYISKLIKISFYDYFRSMIKPVIASIFMVGAFFTIGFFDPSLKVNPVVNVIVSILLCCTAYFFIIFLIARRDVYNLLSVLRK